MPIDNYETRMSRLGYRIAECDADLTAADEAEADATIAELNAKEAASWRDLSKPVPDIAAAVGHAAGALECYRDACRFHHGRAISRGLLHLRGTRAMGAAAVRADELAVELHGLLVDRHEFTKADAAWLEAAFAKVDRSRNVIKDIVERDYYAALKAERRQSREFDQLQELDATPAMYAAWSTFIAVADTINLALNGYVEPIRARVNAAESLACLQAKFREWHF